MRRSVARSRKRGVVVAEITRAQQDMYDAIVTCFDTCQGMVRYSTEESDRYWELAEDLMEMLGKSIGQPVLRVAEENTHG
jgi:hypothetical protein